jgi:hypothetical protein
MEDDRIDMEDDIIGVGYILTMPGRIACYVI